MGLSAGDRLGPFEIVSALGAGGMGEVYRARDTRLHREVALKVLPDAFVLDPDRLARFRREAQLLAALNHPNIATIHGLEESVTPPALVLELVEGPTLADRIVSGPVPLVEALPIATQIVSALEAAHEHGIIHRDLKPSNIKIRPDGTVKVLDFGLAKAREHAVGAATTSQSPTITSPVVTGTGMLLGTAAYMAPEQAKGHAADRRSDMWAFGCVLYEMLTGKMAFGGPDVADTLAAVLKSDPNWKALPIETPEPVRRLLRRCLAKSPNERLADASAARLDLEDARHAPPTAPPASPRFERVAWAGALFACIFGGGAWLWSGGAGGGAVQPEMRVDIASPPTTDLVSMALAPDGKTVAFVASSEGRSLLWLRSLVTGDGRPLPDTDGASFPFWSPDSRSIGFFARERLYRVDTDGGGLKVLARAPVAAGGTWNADGTILFPVVPDAILSQVRNTGGEVSAPPGPEAYTGGTRLPQFLPDGRRYIYFMAQAAVRGVYAGTLYGPERRRLFDADAAAVFVPPARILFIRAGTLFVQGFDTAALSLTGEPVRVASGIALDSIGAPAVSASAAGSIVYRVGSKNRQRQFVWVDRAGRQIGEAFPPDPENAVNPALSTDGRQLLLNRAVDGNADIWLLDLERRGALTRITTASIPEISPRWSPNGRQIYYGGRGRGGSGFSILARAPTAAGEDTIVLDGPAQEIPMDVSQDGRFLLFRSQASNTASVDIWALPLTAEGPPIAVTATNADERGGSFSPDGRWVLFESDESGDYDVFVQPFQRPGERTLLSPGGGTQPRWAPSGTEVFYVARDGRLMSVPLRFGTDGRAIEASSPEALFPSRLNTTAIGGSGIEYAVAPDGKRFLLNAPVEHTSAPITLVLNLAQAER